MAVRVEVDEAGVSLEKRGLVKDRVERLFANLALRTSKLQVSLKHVDRARGGRDKICMVQAELKPGRRLIVVERRENFARAVAACIRRVKPKLSIRKTPRVRVPALAHIRRPSPALA